MQKYIKFLDLKIISHSWRIKIYESLDYQVEKLNFSYNYHFNSLKICIILKKNKL